MSKLQGQGLSLPGWSQALPGASRFLGVPGSTLRVTEIAKLEA